MMSSYDITPLNKVIRGSKRATYDTAQVHAILDSKFLCHIAYVWEGKAIVIPTAYGRDEDKIYIHGSLKNRMMLSLLAAGEACLSVMHLDGLVLARSAFHHSANYRSVTVFGKVKRIEERDKKIHALQCILNHMVPNHWEYVRQPNKKELNATLVLELTIETASAKIRAEGAVDEKEDYDLPLWAGVIPVTEQMGEPVHDALLADTVETPPSVVNYVNGYLKNKK